MLVFLIFVDQVVGLMVVFVSSQKYFSDFVVCWSIAHVNMLANFCVNLIS